MVNEIEVHANGTITQTGTLPTLGEVANHFAGLAVFGKYRERKAHTTLARQDNDLAKFSEYLAEKSRKAQEAGDIEACTPTGDELATDPRAWEGVTWGLVEGLRDWLIGAGYAVSSVNVMLSTIRTYAKLAHKAGTLPTTEYTKIRNVSGYTRKEANHVNEKRDTTRQGNKKADFHALSKAQVGQLKANCDLSTAQGARDGLLLSLMADMGLRAGEVEGLKRGNVNLEEGTLTFYRAKVDKTQTHNLPAYTLRAATAYLAMCGELDDNAPLLKPSRRGGKLLNGGLSTRAITKRARRWGREVLGINDLSAHDLRHTWATLAAKAGTPLQVLKQAGGWASLAMPDRYIKDSEIANNGLRL